MWNFLACVSVPRDFKSINFYTLLFVILCSDLSFNQLITPGFQPRRTSLKEGHGFLRLLVSKRVGLVIYELKNGAVLHYSPSRAYLASKESP